MRYLPLLSTLALAGLLLPAAPQKAEARERISISYSNGYDDWRGHGRGYDRHRHYGHHYGWRQPRPIIERSYYFSQPAYYAPQPVYVVQQQPAMAAKPTYCREYQRTVTIGGRRQEAFGNACMHDDGSWEMMD